MNNSNKPAAGGAAGEKKKASIIGTYFPRHTAAARYISSLRAMTFRDGWIIGNQPNISHKFIFRQCSRLKLCRAI